MNHSDDRIFATRRVAASARRVWEVVTDPAGQVEIDGSGMLRAATNTGPLSAVGDTFDMEMDSLPLQGVVDLPTHYTIRNTVTRLVPNRLLEWAPALIGRPPTGRVYGWQIDAVDDTSCEVTNYCDWSAISDELRARLTWPVVPLSALERSVQNLATMVTKYQ